MNDDAATEPSDEVHRYFPEWADRPDSADSPLEADHNSYLAGGYSEEFGYGVLPDLPPVFPFLLENPELTRQWAVQIGGLHPGYPECARPADRSLDRQAYMVMSSPDRVSPSRDAIRANSPTRAVRVSRYRLERRAPLSIAALGARFRIRLRVHGPGI